MKLDNKNIILTGAASGIGAALLARLSQSRCNIIAVDKDYPVVNEVGNITYYPCDLAQQDQLDQLFDYAIKSWGTVDIFIANAGFAYFGPTDSYNWQLAEKIFSVNTISPMAAAIKMKQLNAERPFAVAMVASAMAHWPLPGYALYAATKAALRAFALAFRHDLSHQAQHLITIYPIGTRTSFFARAGSSPIPLITQSADQVAKSIIRGIENGQSEVYPSQLFRLLLLLNRPLPFIKPLIVWVEKRNYQRWLRLRTQGE